MVIIDARESKLELNPEQIRHISDRKRGIGCDQLILLRHSKNWQELTYLDMYNADASPIEACGNGTRCVADILMTEDKVDNIVVETPVGALNCWRVEGGQVRVEMGQPQLNWRDIPLSKECDTLHLPLEGDPVGVNMGNPHCVFFVEDVDKIDIAEKGTHIEVDPLFPQKTNVEFVQVLLPTHLRMRVWERGTGITEACGSGACATAVAAIRRGLTERKMTITLDGGDLVLEWPDDDAPVYMTGPVMYVFDGTLEAL